jgi:hypothetical protein
MSVPRSRRAALTLLIPAAIGLAGSAEAQAVAPDQPLLHQLAGEVGAERLRQTISTLVGFGTRHTLSDRSSPTRGIGAAERWAAGRFQALGADCGGCLEVITPSETFTGKRVPSPTAIGSVAAIQRGATDPDRVLIISAHIDSRVTDVMNATSDAPGANDDGSGVAAVLEAARILSHHRFPATIVYAIDTGEEQGLYGAKALADYARAHDWRVEADINNDIVGNTHGQDGRVVSDQVRVFSEGVRERETPAEAQQRHATGGELDAPSRQVARFMAALAPRYLQGFSVRPIYRADRYGRGGDQERFLEVGYPAVRVTEADEDYDRQHQDLRVEKGVHYGDVIAGVDFPYLAQVTRLDVVTLAALASAPAAPTNLKLAGAVTADTTLSWSPSPGASSYRVWWRETTAPEWRSSKEAGTATKLTLPGVNIDDFTFGVSAISADGFSSPVEFPGPAGAFDVPAPPPAP